MKIKTSLVLICISFIAASSVAQVTPLTKSLEYGPYTAGFKVDYKLDYSRNYLTNIDPNTYKPIGDYKPRPMQIAIWYPATKKNNRQLDIRDYEYLAASRDSVVKLNRQITFLSDSTFINQTSFLGALDSMGLANTLDIKTHAYFDAKEANGSFPVIIYTSAQSNGVYSNSVLCELLASHGYIVITTPPKPTGGQAFYDATLTDAQFLRGYINTLEHADLNRIATVGYADVFSALAMTQTDFSIKATVALSNNFGGQFYNTTKQNYTYLDEYAIRAPIMTITGSNYQLTPNNFTPSFDRVVYTDAYSLQFKDAVPVSFSSEFMYRWILNLANPNQGIFYDEESSILANEWSNKYILSFLNAYVKGSEQDLLFLKRSPEQNGVSEGQLTFKYNEALDIPPTAPQFQNMVRANGITEARKVWAKVKKDNPNYVILNGSNFLNNLGYQLIGQGNHADAIVAFEMNATDFTTDPNLLDSWGEGLLAANKPGEAAQKFKQVLKWTPAAPTATINNSISLLRELGYKVDNSGNISAEPSDWEPSLDPQPIGERKNDANYNGVQAFDDPRRVSPNREVIQRIGDVNVKIEYGAPYVKGRQLIGGLIPSYRTWRTGANEATVITFDKDVLLEGKPVPKGSYALYSVAGTEEWTVILNRTYAQWGAFTYNANDDLLRAKVKSETRPHMEEMNISFEQVRGNQGTVVLRWGTFAVPFTVAESPTEINGVKTRKK